MSLLRMNHRRSFSTHNQPAFGLSPILITNFLTRRIAVLRSCARQLLPLMTLALFVGTVTADYPLRPVPFNKVEMTSDFWRPRLETQRKTLVPFAFERTQPGVEHLKTARDFLAGKKVEDHRAHRFIDSDLYKVMEGAAYLLQLRHDPELEAKLDELADIIAGAQEANGYLYPSTQRASARRRK
jgi:hypothetical protein